MVSPSVSSAKMPGVEQVELQRLQIPLVRLGPGGREDRIVLSPRDQHRRLVLPEILLPRRVQRRVAAIAQEQVELDLVVAFAVKQELVVGRAVRADELGVFHAGCILPLGCVVSQKASQERLVSPCSSAPSSRP